MRFIYILLLFLGLHVQAVFAEDNILSQFADEDEVILEDNFQGFNRAMHKFNFFLDGVLVSPVARVYKSTVPKGARNSFSNFFSNLAEPYSAINNFLQGEPQQGGNNMVRFLVNTALGFGFFDPASAIGYEKNHEDFGQTLAVWGVGDGGYIVLPIFGPNTVRSSFGLVADNFADPVNTAVEDETNTETVLALQYLEVVDGRAENLDALNDLQDNSVDFYESLKSVYWQSRMADIKR